MEKLTIRVGNIEFYNQTIFSVFIIMAMEACVRGRSGKNEGEKELRVIVKNNTRKIFTLNFGLYFIFVMIRRPLKGNTDQSYTEWLLGNQFSRKNEISSKHYCH